FLGRSSQALAALEGALALYQTVGDVEGQGRVLTLIGHLYASAGTTEAGLARVQPSVALLCTAGLSLGGQAALSIALGRLYYYRAQDRGALEQYREALSAASQAETLARAAQDDHLLGLAKSLLGIALLLLEREEEGAQVLEDALRLLEVSKDMEALYLSL